MHACARNRNRNQSKRGVVTLSQTQVSDSSTVTNNVGFENEQRHTVHMTKEDKSMLSGSTDTTEEGSSTATTATPQPCRKCGVNVQATYQQFEKARHELELLQEKLHIEQEMLKHDKRNFKRRVKARSAAAHRLRETERQQQQQQEQSSAVEELQQQQQVDDYREQLVQVEAAARSQQSRYTQTVEAMQATIQELQQQAATRKDNDSSSPINNSNNHNSERVAELEEKVHDQQAAIERYELELLELERERDAGGSDTAIMHTTRQQQAEACTKCDGLEQKWQETQTENQALQETIKKLQVQLETAQQKADMQSVGTELSQQVAELKLHKSAIQKALAEREAHVELLQQANDELVAKLLSYDERPTAAMIETSAPPESSTSTSPHHKDLEHSPDHNYVMEHEWQSDPPYTGLYTGWFRTATQSPDGPGTLRLDDGGIYIGPWRHGKPHGPAGVYATVDGDVYAGDWHDAQKHGRGVHCWSDGRVYDGPYWHNQRSGAGTMTWPYGAHYQGEFAQDKRNGVGQYMHADGRSYTGNYKDDRPHGQGVLVAKDGTVLYDGNWELGEFLGSSK